MDPLAVRGEEARQPVLPVPLSHRRADPDRAPQPTSVSPSGSTSRPSLSTDRLITCQRRASGRTVAASTSHREVTQVYGQLGSNQKSTFRATGHLLTDQEKVTRSPIGTAWRPATGVRGWIQAWWPPCLGMWTARVTASRGLRVPGRARVTACRCIPPSRWHGLRHVGLSGPVETASCGIPWQGPRVAAPCGRARELRQGPRAAASRGRARELRRPVSPACGRRSRCPTRRGARRSPPRRPARRCFGHPG